MSDFSVGADSFLLDGKPFTLHSGSIHYFRVPAEYWADRLQKLKAVGCNAVETYVCWSLHEPRPGQFDFAGMLDIERFLRTARELGLYAIVRPSPYICAEVDFGGLPPWLLKDPSMRLRCAYAPYLERVSAYYAELLPRLAPLQITHGGNILAMQIENEYGSYGCDKAYLTALEKLMRDGGIDVPLFTSDGGWENMLAGGTLPHIFKTANFGSGAAGNFKALRKFQPEGPLFCCEFWNGWFDHWGTEHHTRDAQEATDALREILEQGGSANLYMFHGGTNFGFIAGANHYEKYSPTVTSYDYDTLLNEWGGYTEKYHAVRRLLLEQQGLPAAELLPAPACQAIGKVELKQSAGILENLHLLARKHESVLPEPMEYYGQNYGLILYRAQLRGEQENCDLYIDGLGDRASVFVNGARKGLLDRNDAPESHVKLGILPQGGQIDVLVDALGRTNYGPNLYDRKGARQIRIQNQLLSHFEVYCMELDYAGLAALPFGTPSVSADHPQVLRGTFTAQSAAECFIRFDGLKKGYIFVNGHNLGRYWAIGPQKTLYCPGCWLRTNEENEILAVELEGGAAREITITDTPDLG
ncbi:MAG: beta-galactosidase [Oscillospiraceae bacterium]|jgi:beta-galactosidase|nr:beta-galactosidase [Oscillospiraceae bacterium]